MWCQIFPSKIVEVKVTHRPNKWKIGINSITVMRIRIKLAFGKVLYGWWFEVSVTYSARYNLIEKVENIYYMTVFTLLLTSSMALTLFYAIKQKSTFIESVCARDSQSVENKRQIFFFCHNSKGADLSKKSLLK